MKRNTKTTITIERYRRFVRAGAVESITELCVGCGRVTSFSAIESVVRRSGVGWRYLFILLESRTVHCIEPEPETIWICEDSLERQIKREPALYEQPK